MGERRIGIARSKVGAGHRRQPLLGGQCDRTTLEGDYSGETQTRRSGVFPTCGTVFW